MFLERYFSFKRDLDIVEKLLYASMNIDDTTYGYGYIGGFCRSIATLIYHSVRCIINKSNGIVDIHNAGTDVLCFWQFPNEKNAIQTENDGNFKNWISVEIGPHGRKGINWRTVFLSNPFLFPKFLIIAIIVFGVRSLRSFAHGYIGYLTYYHLVKISRGAISRPIILTTNMVSPISVAINEFARFKKFDTIYLEHALTPRAQLHGMRYTKYILRSAHTKAIFIKNGIPNKDIVINEKYSYVFPPNLVSPFSFRNIGIALNGWDSFDSIDKLVHCLTSRKYAVFIRMHDADKRYSRFEKMAFKYGAIIESAKSRLIGLYLQDLDFIIAGSSSVLFDAVVYGVPVGYYWQGSDTYYDYYGIVQELGCPELKNPESIEDVFKFYDWPVHC